MKMRYAFWALSFLASMTLASREARARSCSVASDCPKGFDCEPAGVGPDGGPAGACVSLACESSGDCGPGLSCYLDMGTECMTAADGGETCEEHNACVPQWDAPCLADSDCGPGYSCAPANGGSFNCGKNQDAGQPPYAMVTVVACSAVPVPPFPFPDGGFPPGFPAIPSICEAGTTCTEVTWRTCVAQQTGACSGDSDCPSTWTCGCQSTCSELPTPPGQTPIDAGCTKGCIPPNSDLDPFVCAGGVGAPSFGPFVSDGGASAEREGGAPNGAASSGSHGGCQMGSGSAGIGWYLAVAAGLAWARGGRRRRRGAR